MWAILVSGYCSNLYPVLDREAHTMWLSLHFLTMIIGPKHRIEMKEFVLSLTLQSVLLSKKKHWTKPCFFMFLLSLCFVQGPVVRPDERPERPRPAKRRPQTAPTLPGWLVCDLFWVWFTDYLLSLFQVGVFFQIGKPFVCCWVFTNIQSGSWCGLIHLKYFCGSELMNNSAGLYLPALSWNLSFTFEACITKAFYRKSSLN